MKPIGKLFLAAAILAGGITGAGLPQANAAAKVQIMLDGYPLAFSGEPIIVDGTTMVPFRSISESLGIQVTWNQAAKTITAVKGTGPEGIRVQLTLDNKTAKVNGSSVTLAVAPRSVDGNTLIPLSFFSQQFGANVDWDQSTRTVSITSPQERMYTLGFYAISSFSDVAAIPSLDAVAFGWSRIDETGNFTLSGKDFRMPEAAGDTTPDSLIADAAASRTIPYLMVYAGDTKGELTKVVEDPEMRRQAITDMVSTAQDKAFQGIILDFEGLGLTTDKAATRKAFTAFVKQLSTETKSAGLKLSLALHPLNSSYQGYDYKELGKIADELIIMAYDYRAGQTTGNPEPADKVDEAIRLALKETSKSKLLLGLNLNSENKNSVKTLTGLAKRYDLKGIALWRLGLISSEEWTSLKQSVEFKK
ncbi:MAG: stalk domain-containing protein [Paenibacillus macerans]|uniref:Glycosyl hydrolase n=1 Tax=Paenibacillus macerans TaxID=44252 RepID=A0A090Y5V6_PAEMA|nr:stalk domain-containing protein [Paenibacillus macerans]KFM94103.1 glycosyl hydrolases 18 family protein [Paenibacillus macerans]MBS5913762.1 glycosyl hydrolase [Paenibacillus macerans]MCY7557201.1 stalk domain-containing protein [Paenibacillus macerans]MDU7475765.1 stalk domain-containing protein [Paenibacillus macerans]MEC0135299.1 stalk domain-containing protein [Paenibacillus macerans]